VIFDAQVVSIATLDEATGLAHFHYIIERGERLQADTTPPGGFSKHVLDTREPLLIAENMDAEAERYGSPTVAGEDTKSALFVPLITGGRAVGVISLQNADREHAFGESDEQLLETLAGGLSVALENARLVHETRQRNAELALINGVQEAIAGELDPQAIYDAVGDRMRDVFDAQVVSIATFDEAGADPYPTIERASALRRSRAAGRLREARARDARAAADRETVPSAGALRERLSPATCQVGRSSRSSRAAGGGVISLQNIDREHAFDEDDQRSVDVCGSVSVASRTRASCEETRQRVAELGT
jgi:GAF domain-containing protein